MSLQFDLLDGFRLRCPIWVASSHLSESLVALRHWQRINPSAITLKTTSAKGGTGAGHRLLQRIGDDQTLYSSGDKTKEFLDYDTAAQLLESARKLLPSSKIGSSILMGEDYVRCREALRDSDFLELNLKYAARPPTAGQVPSRFELDHTQFEQILEHTQTFLNTFSAYPCFIKLTRELDWLGKFNEFTSFIDVIRQHPRVGIIVANTKKWILPSSRTGFSSDLDGGVIAGDALFDETYNILHNIAPLVPERIPIIATGGINSLQTVIDVLRVGARAIQICTAFQTRTYGYYNYLSEGLASIVRQLRETDYAGFLKHLRQTELITLPPMFLYHPNFYEYPSFDSLFDSDHLEMVIMYGRTFTRTHRMRFMRRFEDGTKRTRIVTMAPESPCISGVAASFNKPAEKLVASITEQHQYWRDLYDKYADRQHEMTIYGHNRVPFHSAYLADHAAIYVPYGFAGEDVIWPAYEFAAGTVEYRRIREEFKWLIEGARVVFSSAELGA